MVNRHLAFIVIHRRRRRQEQVIRHKRQGGGTHKGYILGSQTKGSVINKVVWVTHVSGN